MLILFDASWFTPNPAETTVNFQGAGLAAGEQGMSLPRQAFRGRCGAAGDVTCGDWRRGQWLGIEIDSWKL